MFIAIFNNFLQFVLLVFLDQEFQTDLNDIERNFILEYTKSFNFGCVRSFEKFAEIFLCLIDKKKFGFWEKGPVLTEWRKQMDTLDLEEFRHISNEKVIIKF